MGDPRIKVLLKQLNTFHLEPGVVYTQKLHQINQICF